MFINFASVPVLSLLTSKSFITRDKSSLYAAIVLFVDQLIFDLAYVYDLLTIPVTYKKDEYVTHSFILNKQILYFPL